MKTLIFKWTVSRARDTYGYNICSLWVDGRKVSGCNGGGYDMEGTALACWMEKEFEQELLKLDIPMSRRNGQDIREYYGLSFHDPDFDPGKVEIEGQTIKQREKEGKSLGLERYQAFYGASSSVPSERHRIPLLDGACGMSSIENILNAMGYKLHRVNTGKGDNSIYELSEIV